MEAHTNKGYRISSENDPFPLEDGINLASDEKKKQLKRAKTSMTLT